MVYGLNIAQQFQLRPALVAATLIVSGCTTTSPPIEQGLPQLLAGEAPELSSSIADSLAPLGAEPLFDNVLLDDVTAGAWAVRRSPELRAARARSGVASAQSFASGLLPDPQLQIGIDHPTNVTAFDALTAGLSFDLIGALLNHPNTEARVRAEAQRIREELAWTEWTTAMQARDAAIRVIYLRQQVEIATEAVSETKRQLDIYESAVATGDMRLDDLALRRIGYLDAVDRLSSFARDLDATRVELNGLLGVPPDQGVRLVSSVRLRDLKSLEAFQLFETAIAKRPDLAALKSSYEANEASLRYARIASLPLPNLTLSRARDTSNVHTTGVSASIVLPIWNRGQGDIRVAEATRSPLQAEYAARVFQLRADINLQVEALRRIVDQRTILDGQLMSLTRETDILRGAAERRDVSVLVFETARASLLDKRLMAVGLASAQAQGQAALEGMVGQLFLSRETQ